MLYVQLAECNEGMGQILGSGGRTSSNALLQVRRRPSASDYMAVEAACLIIVCGLLLQRYREILFDYTSEFKKTSVGHTGIP